MSLLRAASLLVAWLLAAAAHAAPGPLAASTLLGMKVRDPATGTEGRLDELVVDLHGNRVHYALLAMGERLLTEPMRNLRYVAERGELVLEARSREPVAPRPGMALVRATALIGWDVESRPGVVLGRVVDFIVAPESGRVPFAGVRLQADPAAGLRAVPLEAFAMYALRANLVFTGEPEALRQAQRFAPESMARPSAGFVERQATLAQRLSEPSASAGASAAGAAASGELFERLDRDANGVLEDRELGQNAADNRSWIAIDLDRDGRITPEEFAGVRD